MTTSPVDGAVLVRDGDRELAASLLALSCPVAPGDWLLVHCGLALARLTETDAHEALRLRDWEVPS